VLYSNGLALDINLRCVFIMERPTIYQRKVLVNDLHEMHHVAPLAQDSITAISGYSHAKKSRFLILYSSLHYIFIRL
jgi:hypothetical protein